MLAPIGFRMADIDPEMKKVEDFNEIRKGEKQ